MGRLGGFLRRREGEEVASGEWRVASLKKKQIPRCARNDKLLLFGLG